MRLVAFVLLFLAAFDWPLPYTDRAGTALLGLAFAALAVGAVGRATSRALPFPLPGRAAQAAQEAEREAHGVLARLREYEA